MLNLSVLEYIMIGSGALVLIIWLFFYFKGRKYNSMFDVLEEKEYPLKEIYGLGYAVLEFFKYEYKTKRDRKLRTQLEVIFEEKYCEYYLRVVHAQQITLTMTVFVLTFILYGLTADMAMFFVGLMITGVIYYYCGTMTNNQIRKRSEEMLHDFSEVVSKLALLTNAGMILREAWEETAWGGEGVIYKEMQNAVNEMNNGKSEIDAVYNFGVRCIIPEIKKFTTTIIQGMSKGSSELVSVLQLQSKEVWQMKKQLVRRAGEKAASKLMIPILIIFIGILIMIMVPIFTNLGIG